jgi:DNA-binding winged helix-turn-helix (wHTH) protein
MGSARVIHHEVTIEDGCDARCGLLRYLDPAAPDGALFMTILHSAPAHNAYGAGDGALPANEAVYDWEGLYIDPNDRLIRVDGAELRGGDGPSVREWDVLRLLVANTGRVVPREVILSRCWGEQCADDAYLLRATMSRLRAKLDAGAPDRFIKTAARIGYRLGPVATRRPAVPEWAAHARSSTPTPKGGGL